MNRNNVLNLCVECAQRLDKHTWPEVPEMIEGVCPQCGCMKSFVVHDAIASAESEEKRLRLEA